MHRDAPYYPIVFYFERTPILFKMQKIDFWVAMHDIVVSSKSARLESFLRGQFIIMMPPILDQSIVYLPA